MIATDLDGTLLKKDGSIGEYTVEILKKAQEMGIYIVPVTGRSFMHIPSLIRKAEFIRYILCVNGARALDNQSGETIFLEELKKEKLMEALDIFTDYRTCWNLHADMQVFRELHRTQDERPMNTGMKLEPDIRSYLGSHTMEIEKMDVYFDDAEERLLALERLRHIEGVHISAAFAKNLEVNAELGNKGEGLLRLAKMLGVKREEIAAFGDAINDIELLRAAGIAVVVENAMPELKKFADYTADSNENEGVARFIEENADAFK